MVAFTRRDSFGMAGLMALGLGETAAAASAHQLNFEDPRERAKIRAKIIGSCVEETVFIFYRLHLYSYMHDGNLVPRMTMNNLNVTKWRPLPNGDYAGTIHESGAYCKFDTDEPIDAFTDPVTGRKHPVFPFLGGPIQTVIGPNGSVTDDSATVKPKAMRLEAFGGVVFMAAGSAFSYPNPFPREDPDAYWEPIRYWDSHSHHMARVVDVANPDINRAPSFSSFQNLVSFAQPMGRPGRSYGKAYGAKLNSLDDIPKAARATLEKQTPEIFDLSLDIWKSPIPEGYTAKRKKS